LLLKVVHSFVGQRHGNVLEAIVRSRSTVRLLAAALRVICFASRHGLG